MKLQDTIAREQDLKNRERQWNARRKLEELTREMSADRLEALITFLETTPS